MNGRHRETVVAATVLGVLLLTWLGFFLHRDPRFPGSGVGAFFGIGAAVLMLLPLGYTIGKRTKVIRRYMNARVSIGALMTLHVYAGLIGALLAIIHTGHRFDSWLGIALLTVMLLVVLSGVVIRYVLAFVSEEVKDKLTLLQTARGDLDNAWGKLDGSTALTREVSRIADAVADLEYSVRMHESFKRWSGPAFSLHVVLSILFYCLLALHIVASVQYGLRWLT